MSEHTSEPAVVAQSIRARDPAVASTVGVVREAPAPEVRRKTTSAILLHRAVVTLGLDAVAPGLGLTVAELDRLDAVQRPMTLEQQRTLALAVLVLSEGHADLRRRAIALLAQVRAAVDFASGVTERHANTPPTNRW